MKTINYIGKSKIIKRIVAILNEKTPLPLDGNGDPTWGTQGQVLTTDGQGGTTWQDAGSGGGGHEIINPSGTAMTQRDGLQFAGSVVSVTDDSVNNKTIVTVSGDLSDYNNNAGFITNVVNDLTNYYLKTETYTKSEVDYLISGIVTLNILVVQTLPTQDISTTTIYLVPKQDAGTSDIYDEYLYINNAWELIGTTQIDLSNYVTTTDLSTALADYVTSVGLATILAGYVQSSDLGNGTITIQKNGTTVDTFTTNQSANKTVNITVTEGHTIWNRIKTALTARAKLWFADASVSDVSADGATKVEVVTELQSENDFDNLATDGTADGVYCFPNSGEEYLTADNIAYDANDSVKEKIDSMNFIPVEKYTSDTCADMYADYGDFTFGAGTVNGGVGKDTPTTSTAWRILQTRLDDYAGIQFAYHTDTDDVYMRRKENNTWSSWVRLALASEVPDMTNVAYKNVNNQFSTHQSIHGSVSVDQQNGTTTTVGESYLVVGNNKAQGTDGNSAAVIRLYGNGSSCADIQARNVTAYRSIQIPDKSGTLALTSDITDVSTGTVTSSHTIGTGTSLKKNGKVVTLSIQITLTSNVAQYASFASVPVGYRNSAYSYAVAIGGYGISVSGSSVSALGAIPTGTVVSCSFTYITND